MKAGDFRVRMIHILSVLAAVWATSALVSGEEMKPYTEKIPGSEVNFDMLPIPAGKIHMGSPPAEAGRGADEGPQHEVSINAFWMGKLEVTWDEYDLFAFSQDIKALEAEGKDLASQPEAVKQAHAVSRPTPPYADPTFGLGREGQPVICITHHSAMEYCRWLSAKTGKAYRLPTEAEWEYACRAGSKSAYSFGDDAAQLKDHAWFLDSSNATPHPGGKKKPNPWGLYDMHGNVAEWCLDHYEKDFYATFKGAAQSPVLLPSDKKYPHVARGGSWDDEAKALRSAARRFSELDWSKQDPQIPQSIWWHTDATFVGFRVVRALNEQDNLKGIKSKVLKEER